MKDKVHPFKILFIEDEKAIRDNYVIYLKMFFMEVYEAEDGEEAYKIYKEKKPDILIIDIHLPKLNGIDFTPRTTERILNHLHILLSRYLINKLEKNFLHHFLFGR